MIKRWIYILDGDARLTERVSSGIKRKFTDYDILELADVISLKSAIKSRRPEIIIISLETVGKEDCFELIRSVRTMTSAIPIRVVVTANRATLDKTIGVLETLQVDVAPLPLRIPQLLEKIGENAKAIEEQKSRETFLKSGDVLFTEGEKAESVYIIQSGSLDILIRKNNEMVCIKTLTAGELVGEMAFIDNRPRSATVVASSDTHAVRLDVGDIQGYLNNQPTWVKLFFKTLVARLREANQKLLDTKF